MRWPYIVPRLFLVFFLKRNAEAYSAHTVLSGPTTFEGPGGKIEQRLRGFPIPYQLYFVPPFEYVNGICAVILGGKKHPVAEEG